MISDLESIVIGLLHGDTGLFASSGNGGEGRRLAGLDDRDVGLAGVVRIGSPFAAISPSAITMAAGLTSIMRFA